MTVRVVLTLHVIVALPPLLLTVPWFSFELSTLSVHRLGAGGSGGEGAAGALSAAEAVAWPATASVVDSTR